MKIEIVPFEKKYYNQVRDLKLKEDDRKECEASNGLPFRRTVIRTLNTYSDSMYLILYKETVSGILGVVPSGTPGIGTGYLLTDDRLEEYKWDVARYSVDVFLHFLKSWWRITNYVSSEHRVALLWLKKCGARFETHAKGIPKAYTLSDPKVAFYKFEFRKEDFYDVFK